jgi:hypothetical protein
LGNTLPLAKMKPPRKYSPLFAIGSAFTFLLFTAGLLITRADPPGLRLTTLRSVGLLCGVWVLGQFFLKRSVTSWEMKGSFAVVLAVLAALLGGVAGYCLMTSISHQ